MKIFKSEPSGHGKNTKVTSLYDKQYITRLSLKDTPLKENTVSYKDELEKEFDEDAADEENNT